MKQLCNIWVNKNLGTKTALLLHLAAARGLNHSVLEMHALPVWLRLIGVNET